VPLLSWILTWYQRRLSPDSLTRVAEIMEIFQF